MIDDLDQLKAALKTATPEPDANARDNALALAQKNFAILQQATKPVRADNIPGHEHEHQGFFTLVNKMLERFSFRFGLYATSGVAVIGIGITLVLPAPTKSLLFDYLQYGEENAKLENKFEAAVNDAETEKPVMLVPLPSSNLVAPEKKEITITHQLANLASSAPSEVVLANPNSIRNLVAQIASESDQNSVSYLNQPMRDAMPVAAFASISSLTEKNYREVEHITRPSQHDLNQSELFVNSSPNTLKIVSENPVSTFSIDVDTASYSFVRSSIMNNQMPHGNAVRVEEMINYFSYDYASSDETDAPFATSVAVLKTPWNEHTKLVRVGIQGKNISIEDRPSLDLVFLIDTSGSMKAHNKLPLLKKSLPFLLAQLKPTDRVSIVTYACSSGVALEPTPASDRATILARLEALHSGGGTAGHEGLQTAYRQAEKMRTPGRIGRVILATDGDFNVGISDDEELKRYVEDKRKNGIYLSVLGFGQGYYNDGLMQALAQNGNGTAAYIDNMSEAMKVLVDQVSGTLIPIANDVKIQVEFNPSKVAEYRLIGYETRALAREDFNNDKVDAGDIGAGHTVTALYEITPVGSPAQKSDKLRYQSTTDSSNPKELGFLKLRYKLPDQLDSQLIETPIIDGKFENTDDAKFSAAIAGFGQLLRGNTKYLGSWSYAEAITLAQSAKGGDHFGYRAEAVRLMLDALSLSVDERIEIETLPNVDIDPDRIPSGAPMVQLGAFESVNIAKSEWNQLVGKHEALFEGKLRIIARASSGGNVFYRLRVMGFSDRDATRRFCNALKALNTGCLTVVSQ